MRKEDCPGFSIWQAYAWMLEEMKKENPEEFKKILNPDGLILLDNFGCGGDSELGDDLLQRFEGSNYVIGYATKLPNENVNQIQTQVKDVVVKGDKKWDSQYVAVYDHPWGGNIVPGTRFAIKKECVDAAREICATEKRDAFVIMGKKPNGFNRCAAQILYKASQGQNVGLFNFVW